jgi:hypothetical protein
MERSFLADGRSFRRMERSFLVDGRSFRRMERSFLVDGRSFRRDQRAVVRSRAMGVSRRLLRRASATAAVLMVLHTAPARAQSPAQPVAQLAEPQLTAAEQAYVDMDFDKANQLADAVAKGGGLTHAQLVRTYELLARTHAILNHDAEARDAFLKLLTYSPDEKEDRNLPPRVTTRLAEARGILGSYPARPGLEVSTSLVPGDGGTLRVTTRDPTHVVQRLIVGWRWGVSGDFATVEPLVGEGIEVPLTPAPPGAARLDYYAGAIDDRGDVVFEVGNRAAPKTALVPLVPLAPAPPPGAPREVRTAPREGRSVFASPVFWVVAGGLLAGAGTAAFFALRRPRDETLPPSSAELSPVLVCGQGPCK